MGRVQRTHREPATGPTTAPRRPARGVFAALGFVLAGVLAAGCSDSGGSNSGEGQGKPGIEGGLEKVAATAGCKPEVQQKAGSGFRQGVCRVQDARYTVMSFTTEADKQTWITEAKQWGGTYLVGPKWVVVATSPTLKTLQEKLGGDISSGYGHEPPKG